MTHALAIGGLGFIGVNLVERLLASGVRTTILTPSVERHAAPAAAFAAKGARLVEGDVRDRSLLAHVVPGQHVVFNLSGQSGAIRSMEDPSTDLDVNCGGNLALLEAVRESNPGAKLVFVGSRLQYGRPAALPVPENAAIDPLSIHAIHKQTVEQYLKLYRRLFGLRYAVARVTNPYGPGQPSGRTAYGVVNRLMHLALADDTLIIYGDGAQQRDYIHVDDVVSALVRLGESDRSDGGAYNVGSGTGTRMIDLANAIVSIAGTGRVEHAEWPPLARQIETGDFVADVSKISDEIGWTPAVPLRTGLERTLAHYRALAAL
jgi:UDP-glucose 4-epimerase